MSMIAIGEKLKQAREKKGVTLEQVQKQTLIHVTVLVALEDGKCDDLLTPTYVKSFLKKYAGYLGLDSKELLNEYAALHADKPVAAGIEPAKAAKPKKAEGNDPFLLVRRSVVAVVALLVISLLLFLAYSSIRLLYSLSQKSHKAEKAAVMKTKRAGKAEKTAPRKALEKNSAVSNKLIVPKGSPLVVLIKVKAPVWVEAKKDGEKIFQRVLPKGLVESLTARDKIELFVANGDVIEVILNGRPLGSPGKGVIKNLEITRSGMKIK